MKQPSVQIDRERKTVTIVMPLEKPHPSRSTGKTLVIATTGGLRTSDETYARQPVFFTANVFFYPTSKRDGKHLGETEDKQRLSTKTHDLPE